MQLKKYILNPLAQVLIFLFQGLIWSICVLTTGAAVHSMDLAGQYNPTAACIGGVVIGTGMFVVCFEALSCATIYFEECRSR